ncbi:hypothetical protein [Stenotrophomonas indicatrix]|uniref:hypothetical protein n=1 Tax=Stenotrophomonas indicatrix TaxID=2045451 RepID=UPI0013FD63FB|nr:hypothetical protein [Stenotrophomonas indicatrix]
MDGAIEPHGRVYGVSCKPTPPRQPAENPEPAVASALAFVFASAGAGRQPGQPSLPDLHMWLPNPAVDLPECAIALPE